MYFWWNIIYFTFKSYSHFELHLEIPLWLPMEVYLIEGKQSLEFFHWEFWFPVLLITTLAVSVGLGFCWQENCVASLLCFWVKWETCLFFFFPLCAHTTVCVTVHRLGTCIYRALRIVSSSVLLLSPCNAFLKIYLQYSRHNQGKVEKKKEKHW